MSRAAVKRRPLETAHHFLQIGALFRFPSHARRGASRRQRQSSPKWRPCEGLFGRSDGKTTLFSIFTNLLHFNMIIAGLFYSRKGQMSLEEIVGGAPSDNLLE